MGNVFGTKKSPAASQPADGLSDQDRAILELKRQKDRLSKYQVRVHSVIAREVEAAKILLKAGKKSLAVLALKRKKYQESLLEKTQGEIENLNSLVNSIEFAAVSQQVFAAISQGNQVLQSLNEELSIEKVESLMEETKEAIEYQNQISEMLGNRLSNEDEAEVENQLKLLEEETIRENLPTVKNNKINQEEIIEKQNEENNKKIIEKNKPAAAAVVIT